LLAYVQVVENDDYLGAYEAPQESLQKPGTLWLMGYKTWHIDLVKERPHLPMYKVNGYDGVFIHEDNISKQEFAELQHFVRSKNRVWNL
jgi:hypothetical protein